MHTGGDDAGEYHATNFVLGDRLDSYTESSQMLVSDGTNRLDRRITYETSE